MVKVYRKLIIERNLVNIKATKLWKFINSEHFQKISETMQRFKIMQHKAMAEYVSSLDDQIHYLETEDRELINSSELTIGEERIGNFNPLNNESINEIKLEAITLINTIDSYSKDPRRLNIALTNIETGAMFGVKSQFP